MLHLLKTWILLVIAFLLFLAFPKPTHAFIDALQSDEYNLESMLGGKVLINPQAPTGILPTFMDTTHVIVAGAVDSNGTLINQGASGVTSSVIASMYTTKPASTTNYLAYLKHNINPVSPVFAATNPGSTILEPILKLWIINRNIAYIFFIVIFVIIGFMIMFRTKLNPQTIINLQLALPKVIIALILVTFSYAIAGFIIDLVFIINGLIYNIYSNAFNLSPDDVSEKINFINILLSDQAQWPAVWTSIGEIFAFKEIIEEGVHSRLFNLILALTLFGTAIKIFFTLLTKYVTLIIQATFSPLFFLISAIPSPNSNSFNIIKSMFASALAFPAIYFILVLSGGILTASAAAHTDIQEMIGIPPFNSGPTSIIQQIASLSKLVALGILMTAPAIPQMIDKALSTPTAPIDTSQIAGVLRKIPVVGGLIG